MKNDENKKKQSIRNVVDRMTQWVVAKFAVPIPSLNIDEQSQNTVFTFKGIFFITHHRN